MTNVFNPTSDCQVRHNVNGNVYECAPGETCKVRDEDVMDLLKLLSFLVVVEGDKAQQPVINSEGELTLQDVPLAEVKKKKEPKKFQCVEKVEVVNEETGRKKTVQCGFSSAQKKALIGHLKQEHAAESGSLKDERATKTRGSATDVE